MEWKEMRLDRLLVGQNNRDEHLQGEVREQTKWREDNWSKHFRAGQRETADQGNGQ